MELQAQIQPVARVAQVVVQDQVALRAWGPLIPPIALVVQVVLHSMRPLVVQVALAVVLITVVQAPMVQGEAVAAARTRITVVMVARVGPA